MTKASFGALLLASAAIACRDSVMYPERRARAESMVAGRAMPALAKRVSQLSDQAMASPVAALAPTIPPPVITQKIIRSAELSARVDDVERAVRVVDSIATAHEAVMASSRIDQGTRGSRSAWLTVHVPASRFNAVLAALHGVGEGSGETITSDDITKQYMDLQTRLAVKEETATRLRALLSNRTAKLSDVLEVERELARVVTELEQMKGEQRYYDQRVAVSSISLHVFESIPATKAEFTGPVVAALKGSVEVLGQSLAGIIYLAATLLPWAAVASVLWWFARRVWRNRRLTLTPASQVEPDGSPS